MIISDFRKQVQDIIASRRTRAEFVAKQNMDKMLDDKTCHDLYYNIREQELSLAKEKFAGGNVSKIEKDIATKKQQLKNGITNMGLRVKDLIPQYYCKKCNDTGYIDSKKCTCYNALLSSILMDNVGIKTEQLQSYPDFEDVSFDCYKPDFRANIKALYDLMKRYVDELQSTKKLTVTICGGTGVGKTTLCCVLAKYAVKSGIYTLFTSAIDLNKAMLNYHCALNNDKDAILEPYMSCDLLIIDDLGTEPMLKNVTKEYLYMILTTRIAKGLHTIINTNFDTEYILNHYEERIFSRLCAKNNAIVLNMESTDLRLATNKK